MSDDLIPATEWERVLAAIAARREQARAAEQAERTRLETERQAACDATRVIGQVQDLPCADGGKLDVSRHDPTKTWPGHYSVSVERVWQERGTGLWHRAALLLVEVRADMDGRVTYHIDDEAVPEASVLEAAASVVRHYCPLT